MSVRRANSLPRSRAVSTDLKLLTALVVAVFLAVPYWKGRYFTKPVRKEGAPHA